MNYFKRDSKQFRCQFFFFGMINVLISVEGATDFKCLYYEYEQPRNYSCISIYIDYKKSSTEPINVVGNHLNEYSNTDVVSVFILHRKVEFIPFEFFKQFSSTEYLIISNQLKEINDKSFQGASELKEIIATGNLLKSLEANIFQSSPNLIKLFLDSNFIRTVNEKSFANLQDLEMLHLGKNSILTLPKDIFFDLKNLKILMLNSNRLERLESGLFQNNLKLEIVIMSNNKIGIVSPDLFNNLNSFNYIDLSWNTCISMSFSNKQTLVQINEKMKECSEDKSWLEKIKLLEKSLKEKTSEIEKLHVLIDAKELQENDDNKNSTPSNKKTQLANHFNILCIAHGLVFIISLVCITVLSTIICKTKVFHKEKL